jgi:hypothetical protein
MNRLTSRLRQSHTSQPEFTPGEQEQDFIFLFGNPLEWCASGYIAAQRTSFQAEYELIRVRRLLLRPHPVRYRYRVLRTFNASRRIPKLNMDHLKCLDVADAGIYLGH